MNTSLRPRSWLLVGVLVCLALWLCWNLGRQQRVRPPAPSVPDSAPVPAEEEEEEDAGLPPPAPSRQPTHTAAVCRPRADLVCRDGDVVWADSCGRPGDLAELCFDRGCRDGACLSDEARLQACSGVSAYGQCNGDVAVACRVGELVRYDCASVGQRCVMTREGALCVPRPSPLDPLACDSAERASCEGSVLRLCIDGRVQRIDCGHRNADCMEDGARAYCRASDVIEPLLPGLGELCDGEDNDADGLTDEAGVCQQVPLVAFVPRGSQLPYLEQRMQRELNILNQVYAPMRFYWSRLSGVSEEYGSFEPGQLPQAAGQLSVAESRSAVTRSAETDSASSARAQGQGLDFYIPVLLTQRIESMPTKVGLSTLPNARCGGVRVSDAPSIASGLIVLSEERAPETLTHEMGHYLGLCHTHEQLAQFALRAGDALSCEDSGDGICDTPVDPGADACLRAGACEVVCSAGEQPDAFNIMSYYFGCRQRLTAEQRVEAARGLALRREWFRCLDQRDCPCDPEQKQACPSEMSCRPTGETDLSFVCELDGPTLPGRTCQASNECSGRAFCVRDAQSGEARCVRPCGQELGCTCRDAGLAVQICAEDLD